MKLFGEYLVEKNIISSEQLVQALVGQLKSLPSPAEVIFENKFLSTDQILTIFRLQVSSRRGFVASALELKLWSADLEAQVDEQLLKVRVPLGQVLVKTGAATLEQITHALDDFLGESEVPKVAPPVPTVQMAAQAPSEIVDYTPFSDLLTDALRERFDTWINGDASVLKDTSALKDFKDEIHRLRGAARLVSAHRADSLLMGFEGMLELTLSLDLSGMSAELIGKFKVVVQKVIELLWQIRQSPESDSWSRELKGAEDSIQLLSFDFGFLAQGAVG